MIGRIVIDDVRPRTPSPDHPAKAVVGEEVRVSADVFRDGHDVLGAHVRWRPDGTKPWTSAPMAHVVNDRWEAVIEPTTLGAHEFVVEAWTDRFATWRHNATVKLEAGQDISLELEEAARLVDAVAAAAGPDERHLLERVAESLRDESLPFEDRMAPALSPSVARVMAGPHDAPDLTAAPVMRLWVDRERALYGAWYEFFPRSEGGFRGALDRLPAVAAMGFDVVYFPPIHPIGSTARKGRDNTLSPAFDDPGSPWAIGGPEGGHTAIHPDLGTIEEFEAVVRKARELGMELALDYALQCSPDHPWVREHPEWFKHRPDGSIAYAENPPKKYQDIYPIEFWPADESDRVALWDACKGILDHWIGHGVRIFRVDNPHTKPMAFWEWLIPAVQAEHPDVLFLAEAFTRPKVMAKLAEVGFSQSYTYFTWRNERWEFVEYLEELCHGPKADYMRPNFWPNTPDILSGPLRNGGPSAFKLRLFLAATMVPSYGIYSGYELFENAPASDTNEEYLHSEKYEVKHRPWDAPWSLTGWITHLNEIRRRHPAFARLRNLRIHGADNESVLVWSKRSDDGADTVLVVANLDPHATSEATLQLDLEALGVPWDQPFVVQDELTGQSFEWLGPHPYVRLDPASEPGHILTVRTR